jgi:hypothetical protein
LGINETGSYFWIMGLIIRIDVDRPYGRNPIVRHLLSRLSSDVCLPKIPGCGYLAELEIMLSMLNAANAHAHVFFRRCTLPSESVIKLLSAGRHEAGLHLENSRSFETFRNEVAILEDHLGRRVVTLSKHGSGNSKFGFHHYAPYEPAKYTEWAERISMRLFLGNLEDPRMKATTTSGGLLVFPSAFWLEPHWRDTTRFTVEWLLQCASDRDIVLLVHPENVLADSRLIRDFERIIQAADSTIPS